MAITAPNVAAASGANIRTFDITSSGGDDAVTGLAAIPHGLGFTPTLFIATPTIATAAAGTCYSITNAGATTFDFVKSTNVGSGLAGVLCRVYIGRWMSVVQ
jgi:hypothetical protein